MNTSPLFSPFSLRGIAFRNRVAMSPMCQYCARDGLADDWHLVHLGSRAVGGAGLVMVEATAVTPQGRISPGDLGIWSDTHIAPLARIARFLADQGAVPGLQLAHAGRKASCQPSWAGGQPLAGASAWEVAAPSALAFSAPSPLPRALGLDDIATLAQAYSDAAERATRAGFKVIEIHAAHGYLLHSFLSPLSNRRTDCYGGSFDGRIRLLSEVVEAVRAAMPASHPLLLRISATDWVDGGWTLEQSVALASVLKTLGVDMVDVSSGGLLPDVAIPLAPGYQAPFARQIRLGAQIPTAAVGLIRNAAQAQALVQDGMADMIFLGRALMRDPYWVLKAREQLEGVTQPMMGGWPPQYKAVAGWR